MEETFGGILAQTKRSRDEALYLIKTIQSGTAPLAPGMTSEKALQILQENIQAYNEIIGRLDWRNNA